MQVRPGMCYTPRMTERYGQITDTLLGWYAGSGRRLPFRGARDPYLIWVSEIMLQQTRTETVGAYYRRFIRRFPTVEALAGATEEEVLKHWEGLGYYGRARNLRLAAGIVQSRFGGVLPADPAALRSLPGIGPYTAAAIASIAFNLPEPAIDGNLTRVLSRLFCVREDVDSPAGRAALRAHGQRLMPARGAGDMNQALMDLGATVCLPGTPDCGNCPLNRLCGACLSGEQEKLPVSARKKKPQEVPVGLILLTCKKRVLLVRRTEALLRGLYVFLLREGDASLPAALEQLRTLGIDARGRGDLGEARHVFTHRVWEMRMRHFETERERPVRDGLWADREAMRALPLPVAMRKAGAFAREILEAP